MKFELVKIFHLLLSRLFSFDDCFSCWVSLNQTFINGIEDGSFQLVMKIHCCLMLVMLSVSVDEFLIAHTIELGKLEIRDKLSQPRLCELVFLHCHFPNRTFLVDVDPLRVVIAERHFFVDCVYDHTGLL